MKHRIGALAGALFVLATTPFTTPCLAETTLTIATVNNGDMIRMQGLTSAFTAKNPGHHRQMGDARGECPAPARHHRHRHQGRAVRRAHHRHLRGADLGQAELARSARQPRGRLRRERSLAQDPRRSFREWQALRRALLWRELDADVSHRPLPKGGADDAGGADLGVRHRRRQEAHRQVRRHLRRVPARQGRLGREHGVPHGHVQFFRRPLVR